MSETPSMLDEDDPPPPPPPPPSERPEKIPDEPEHMERSTFPRHKNES